MGIDSLTADDWLRDLFATFQSAWARQSEGYALGLGFRRLVRPRMVSASAGVDSGDGQVPQLRLEALKGGGWRHLDAKRISLTSVS